MSVMRLEYKVAILQGNKELARSALVYLKFVSFQENHG